MLVLVSTKLTDFNYIHHLLITDLKLISIFINDLNSCINYNNWYKLVSFANNWYDNCVSFDKRFLYIHHL